MLVACALWSSVTAFLVETVSIALPAARGAKVQRPQGETAPGANDGNSMLLYRATIRSYSRRLRVSRVSVKRLGRRRYATRSTRDSTENARSCRRVHRIGTSALTSGRMIPKPRTVTRRPANGPTSEMTGSHARDKCSGRFGCSVASMTMSRASVWVSTSATMRS